MKPLMADPATQQTSRWAALPSVVRLILANAFAGAMLGAVVGVLLLIPQGFGLGHLVATSDSPYTAAGLLIFGMMGTFGGLVAGSAIMLSGRRP